MCYMASVSVRELRQNLSVHLRRVARGEALEVTSRGVPVAALAPLPDRLTARERLIAAGRLQPGSGNLVALGAPVARPVAVAISSALAEERVER